MFRFSLMLLALGWSLLAAGRVSGDTVYVNGATGNDAWSGLCATWDGGTCGPKRTIQAGVDAAQAGDEVLVADGVYTGDGNTSILIGSTPIVLRSAGGPAACIIDGQGVSRVLRFANGTPPTTRVEGFTLRNGLANQGAGVYCASGTQPVIRNCVISGGNTATLGGGGAYCNASAPTFEDCTFVDNSGEGGGGAIAADQGSAPVIRGCTFANNTATAGSPYRGYGGAIHLRNFSTALLENCRFYDNVSGENGGAIALNADAQATLRNCLFIGGTADRGGILALAQNCTATVLNCSLLVEAGTAAPAADVATGSSLTLTNTLIWAYEPVALPLIAVNGAGTIPAALSVDHCFVLGGQAAIQLTNGGGLNWGAGNSDANPHLAFTDEGFVLRTSPCLEAGDNAVAVQLPPTDLIGNPRLSDADGAGGATLDVGCYEFNPLAPTIAIDRGEFVFDAAADGAPPPPQTLQLVNAGAGALQWSAVADQAWLSAQPPGGTSNGEVVATQLHIDQSGLLRGVHTARLHISDPAAANSPRKVEVTLRLRGSIHVPAEFGTIQAAVNAALDGDVILLADGVYRGPGNRGVTWSNKNLTIRSASGDAEACVIDCERAARALSLGGGQTQATVIADLTIRNGRAQRGAGVECRGSGATFRNVRFISNSSREDYGDGGAVFGTSLLIENCDFDSNSAYHSGGAAFVGGSEIRASRFRNNYAREFGGAVAGGTTVVADCEFTGNIATTGSAAYTGENAASGGLRLLRCTFRDNFAFGRATTYGGGSELHAVYCLFENNQANDAATAHATAGVSGRLVNCVLVRNWARTGTLLGGSGLVEMTNCILTENTPATPPTGTSLVVRHSVVPGGWPGEGNLPGPAGLAAADDYRLAPDSPCINAGATVPAEFSSPVDFEGIPAPDAPSGVRDIGIYEFDPTTPRIGVSTNPLITGRAGQSAPILGTIEIRNAGGGTLNWSLAAPECSWLTLTPTTGASTTELDSVEVRIEPGALPHGEHVCLIEVTAPGASNTPRTCTLRVRMNDTLDVPGDYPTIQAAIDAAVEDDEIVLADGVHSGPGNRDLNTRGKAITVRSASGQPELCVVDSEYQDRALTIASQEDERTRFNGITFRRMSVLTAREGGVFVNEGSRPLFENCAFLESSGTAVCLGYRTSAAFLTCRFAENAGSNGGAVLALADDYFNTAEVLFDRCLFEDNDAQVGGAVCAEHSNKVILRNCLLRRNHAVQMGGAIGAVLDGFPAFEVQGCTLVENTSDWLGGAILGSSQTFGTVVANSVLWDNTAAGAPNQIYIARNWRCLPETLVRYCDIEGGTAGAIGECGLVYETSNLALDPLFIDAAGGNYRLPAVSPCIDAGDPAFVPRPGERDLDGHVRVWNGRIDIGAYEFGAAAPGDVDCSGAVNNFDIDAFVLALSDLAAYALAYPDCEAQAADVNGDGLVNNFDIDAFVALLNDG